ncbi:GNAT family N-acetyltransferase [Luteipulveratus mongoliensis]|uniref:GCN5 family acetyltransferase n=1 Tax=Luteipulveratus mongoliensis TaxID=571913 RepID=A0A0K1JFA2_9MICO|nr:GNAT family N-acetyltransferase [Luteipulveratus mongoliensis]AKU15381.1 GCN5 family acetyltransferase [Luteipulveratus mongoliensis]
MLQLVAPRADLHVAWLEAHHEWGPGTHEDGFGVGPDDDVESAAGFADWVDRLVAQADPASAAAMGKAPCTCRWIVEDEKVVGGIALRHGLTEKVQRLGHIGYGIRPSARGRGLATWALGQMLTEAARLGESRVLLVCRSDNVASRKTIERLGGVLEPTSAPEVCRYWIST